MPSVEQVVAELSGTVRDVMSKQVVAVSAKTSAADVADRMAASGVRHAVVVDAERKVAGIVSQREIFSHFMETLHEKNAIPSGKNERAPWEVGSLIRKPPITVSPDAQLGKAGFVLASCKIDCLPVVDENNVLLGTLSVKEVLRHIVGKLDAGLEDQFTFYTTEKKSRPQMPAFFRRANGALVMPVSCLEDPTSIPGFAVLGFEPATGRIAVKFVADLSEEGARKVAKDGDNLVIAAGDFVARFEIKHVSAFDITRHRNFNCMILTPRQQAPTGVPQTLAPAAAN